MLVQGIVPCSLVVKRETMLTSKATAKHEYFESDFEEAASAERNRTRVFNLAISFEQDFKLCRGFVDSRALVVQRSRMTACHVVDAGSNPAQRSNENCSWRRAPTRASRSASFIG